MEIVRRLEDLCPGIPSAVTVGVFDGVHLGHQMIMHLVRAAGTALGGRSVAVTFDRDPEELANPQSAQGRYITTLRQKVRLIAGQGLDLAVVLPLERQIMDMAAEEFVISVLHEKLAAVRIIVGTNFRFGKDRAGDVHLLRRMGKQMGFEVLAVSPIRVDDMPVSSTFIRKLLMAGDIERANEFLGHPFALEGPVVAGDGIGRSLGYPTANIQPAEIQILPAKGVYAVSVNLDGVLRIGVANIGNRPTVSGRQTAVEVFIIGFSGDVYGRELEIAFHHRLRSEVRFEDTEELKEQIGKDIDRASELIG